MNRNRRNLILYLFGTNTSVFGDVMLTTALALYVMELTKSPQAFGGVLAVAFIPRLVLNLFSGALVDKLNSRIVMISLDFFRGLIMLAVCMIDSIDMTVIMFLVILFAAADTFFIPASISVVPRLFEREKISYVNSLDQSLRSILNVVSPLIASALMLTVGLKAVLLIDGATFIFSGIAECLMTFDNEKSAKSKGSLFADMADGAKVIFKDVRVRSLLINGALTHLFLFTFIEVGMISLLVVTFGRPQHHYGMLQSVISVSAIIASALAMARRSKRSTAEHINSGIVGMIFSVLLFLPLSFRGFTELLLNHTYYPLIYLGLCCFAMYLSFGYYVVFFRSFYQSTVPSAYLGRFSSIFMILVSVSRITGSYMYGWMFENLELVYPITVLAMGMLIKLIAHVPFLNEEKRLMNQSATFSK